MEVRLCDLVGNGRSSGEKWVNWKCEKLVYETVILLGLMLLTVDHISPRNAWHIGETQ